MSYDIGYYTKDSWDKEEKVPIKVAPYKAEGGTIPAEKFYCTDGKFEDEIGKFELIPSMVSECEMNITYNYGKFYREHINKKDGIRWIFGKTGTQVKSKLEKAIQKLGIEKNTSPFWQINVDYTFGKIFEGANNVKFPLPISEEKHQEYIKVKDWDVHPDKDNLVKLGYLQDGGSYWKATPGNAGYALMKILTWIIQNPDGIFNGD